MRYPAFLKEKGRIGFIAPSFGCATEPYALLFDRALERFESQGFKTVCGPNCRACKGTGKSNTPLACAEEINDFFLNDLSDIIISCGGGETMCEDLNYVDFESIAKAPAKWFMGYSDNTCLTFTLPVLCDTAAVYGPCVSAFGASELHESVHDAFDLLCGKKLRLHNYKAWESEEAGDSADPYAGYAADTPFEITAIDANGRQLFGKDIPQDMVQQGAKLSFEGRLLGGCIDILSCLCGTRFDKTRDFCEKYKEDGIVWFLEACDLDPMGIRRALWQLRSAGWFDTAKGFIFGRPLKYDATAFGMDRIDAVVSAVGDMGVPVILDADLGHLPPMMPVISGAMAAVCASQAKLSIEQRLI